MASNRGVAYMGPGVVEIHSIDFPKLALGNRKCEPRSYSQDCFHQHLR
jgi:glutathione-independent formaldehyde dehydrogenase